jgi:hypothetical protein
MKTDSTTNTILGRDTISFIMFLIMVAVIYFIAQSGRTPPTT